MQAPKEGLLRTRAFLSATALLAASLLAGLGIATVIVRIQHKSDQARQGQMLLIRLDKQVYQLKSLEGQTATYPSLAHTEQANLDALNSQALQNLDDLDRVSGGSAALPLVRRALLDYEQAFTDEFHLFSSGRNAEARRAHDDRVNPAYEALSDAIHDANVRCDGAAVSANNEADVGTRAVLLLAAFLLFVLIRRFAHSQRLSTRLVTEREILRQSEERFQALIRNTSDVIAILAPDGVIRYLSSAAQRLWGVVPERLEGSSAFTLMHPDEVELARTLVAQAGADPGGGLTTELRLRYADGSWRQSELILTNLLTEPGIEGIVLTCRDVSERKAFEEQLAHQAFHDALTGLPNRALFMERLRHALARGRRQGTMVGVIFLDLDNFKFVNDSLGHGAGDHLLVAVAERLNACIRAGDTVARLGGDEFTVLLEDLADDDQLLGLAERITQVLHTPILVGGREIVTTGSLGIAASLGDSRLPDELLREADTAMYRAKTTGKARSIVFDRSMNAQAVDRLNLEMDLRRALEMGEFRVFYQPIISLASGAVSEVEALVRWEHPERGLIPPINFIPLAEEIGLIVPLGLWVLREACWQTREWNEGSNRRPPLTVSVNVSARQLKMPDFVAQVVQVLNETGFDTACLKLEITESVMMQETEVTIGKMHALKALGIRLAVDDFGTGYSSMAYLSSLPIDTLKIDRAFVGKMSQHTEDAAIVRAIVMLAKTLNLRITSEGIETVEQLAQLRALECDLGQGYHFSRPLPADQLQAFLALEAAPGDGRRGEAASAREAVAAR